MKKWFKRANKKVVDGIKFDSPEEIEVYEAIKNNTLHILTWINNLKDIKLLDARPNSITLLEGKKLGSYSIRKRVYTHDFTIFLNGVQVLLEVKSKWSEAMPDYRLRRAFFLLLHWTTYNFAELIKVKKSEWLLRKYY